MIRTNSLGAQIPIIVLLLLAGCDRVLSKEPALDPRVAWNLEIERQFTDHQNKANQVVGSELMSALKTKSDIIAQLPEQGDVLLIIHSNQDQFEYSVRLIQEAPIAKANLNDDRILHSKSKLNCAKFPEFYRTEAFLNTFGGSQGELICISSSGTRRLYFQSGDIVFTQKSLLDQRRNYIRIEPWNVEYALE